MRRIPVDKHHRRHHHHHHHHGRVDWRNFTLESGGDQWRRQDLVSGGHDDRGAEWGGVWEGVSAPQPTRWSAGSVVSSPSGVRGGVPVAIAFSAYFRPQTLLVARKIRVSCPKAVVTVTTTFKSGGDKSLSSRTKLRLCRVAGEGRRVVAPPYPQHASRALQWDGWNRFVAGRATCSVDDATFDVDTRAAEKSLQFFVSYRIKLVSSTSFG